MLLTCLALVLTIAWAEPTAEASRPPVVPGATARSLHESEGRGLDEVLQHVVDGTHGEAAHGEVEDNGGEHAAADAGHGHDKHHADHGDEAGHGHGAGAEGHGHDHGGHHHHHHAPTRMGTATAVMLLGFVAFVMLLFYLVNWHDKDIRQYTWIVISSTVSIFCAVLMFSAVAESMDYWSEALGIDDIYADFCLFLILWFVTQGFLHIFKRNFPPLKAFGTVGAHITGFAAIHVFLGLQVSRPFGDSPAMGLLVIFIFIGVSSLLVFVGEKMRGHVGRVDGTVDEADHHWFEQCEETEDDAIGLCLSALVCVEIRFIITGETPTPHGAMEGRTEWEVVLIYLVAVLFAFLAAGATSVLRRWKQMAANQRKVGFALERAADIVAIFLGLGMSWCLYFGSQWWFFILVKDSSMQGVTGKMAEAFCISILCMLMVFVLDKIGDGHQDYVKACRGMITSLGLLVGISWENAFNMAVDEVATAMGSKSFIKNVLALLLVGLVLPAWRLYILPKSDEEVQDCYKKKIPPLTALCCYYDPEKDSHLSKSELLARLGVPSDDGYENVPKQHH